MLIKDDRLGRQELVNRIFSFINYFSNQDNEGFTLLINGKYGCGKTTLIDFIIEENKKGNVFNILYHNAWENNYFRDPMPSILDTLLNLRNITEELKVGIKKLFKHMPSVSVNVGIPLVGLNIGPSNTKEGFNIHDFYIKYKKEILDVQKMLEEISKDKKIVFIVDELDRCLPSYQIKVLEALYHFLNIPNIFVIIALDKNQLEHSIETIFGNNNIEGYLSKFIDYSIDLPEGNIRSLYNQLLDFKIGNKNYENVKFKEIIIEMLVKSNIDLRTMKKLIRQMNIIIKPKSENSYVNYKFPFLLAFLLILKNKSNNIYNKYFGIPKETNSHNEIRIDKSRFSEFYTSIQNDDMLDIVNYIKNDNLLYLNLINLFDDLLDLNKEDISNIIGHDSITQYKNLITEIEFYGRERINTLINQVNILQIDMENN